MIRCWVNVTRVRHNSARRERGEMVDPPIVVERDGIETFASDVQLLGNARLVYDIDGLPNGVRVWVEADDCKICGQP